MPPRKTDLAVSVASGKLALVVTLVYISEVKYGPNSKLLAEDLTTD